MIKIGLIGIGFMGGMHAACYEALLGQNRSDFKVTAVADIDPERAKKAAEKFGAVAYSSGEELIEKADVNTVDICLPTFLHAAHAIKAMKKGFNVLVEKPICMNDAEAAELLDVQKETNANVMVGQVLRFWDEYVYLKDVTDSKEFGEIVSGVLTRLSPKPDYSWEGWLHTNCRSGSAALDLHIHDVDYIRYLLGDPDSIKADVTLNGENPEHIFSILKYGNKVITLEGGWDLPATVPFEMGYRIKFEKATVVFTLAQSPTVKVYPQCGEAYNPEIKAAFQGSVDAGGNLSSLGGYYNEIKYFVDSLTSGKKIERATLSDAVGSFRLYAKEIEAAKK